MATHLTYNPVGHAEAGYFRHKIRGHEPTPVEDISELTVKSRNGCDQMKSNAEFRIAARVRSDLPILGIGCGLTLGGDNDGFVSDILSIYKAAYVILTTMRTQNYCFC